MFHIDHIFLIHYTIIYIAFLFLIYSLAGRLSAKILIKMHDDFFSNINF